MKKLLAVLVMVLIFANFIVPTLAEETEGTSFVQATSAIDDDLTATEDDNVAVAQDIVVKINDVPVDFDVKPVIIKGRTMVPLRAIFEGLGAIVTWDGDTNTIYGSKGSSIIILQVANTKAFVNSTEIQMDVAPQIINSRTLVPTRFVAEALSADVKWDAQTSTVIITTSEPAPTATPVVDTVKTFNAATLATFNGKNGNSAYIAVNGNVYDVTNSSKWIGGAHKGNPAGIDYTSKFKQVHDLSILDGLPIVGKYSN